MEVGGDGGMWQGADEGSKEGRVGGGGGGLLCGFARFVAAERDSQAPSDEGE